VHEPSERMGMDGIARWGAFLPAWRLERALVGRA
jgi:hypothetical protein